MARRGAASRRRSSRAPTRSRTCSGGGDFDVYPDTRSQVYGGIAAESSPARDAVNGTAGQVVLYKGELAQTFFFSSSGGRTANVQDVWSSKPTPYLVSVPDPYDTLSPYHDWGPLKFSALQLGKRLGSRGTLLDVRTERRRRRPRALADADRLEGRPHDQRLERRGPRSGSARRGSRSGR